MWDKDGWRKYFDSVQLVRPTTRRLTEESTRSQLSARISDLLMGSSDEQ